MKAQVYGCLLGGVDDGTLAERLFKAPHKLLDAYVCQLTSFTPLDGDSTILREEPDISSFVIETFETFEWKRIAERMLC
jgi:hypothetical protein